MQLKRYASYQMNFLGKSVTTSGAFMGLSLFLRMLHYAGFNSPVSFGIGTVIFSIVLPTAATIAYIVLLKCLHWNAPGIYGIIGSVFCILTLIWNLSCGNALRALLSIPWYPIAALILLATVAGYVPGKLLSCLFFAIPIAFRLFLLVAGRAGLMQWSAELCELCVLAALACLPYALLSRKNRQTPPVKK